MFSCTQRTGYQSSACVCPFHDSDLIPHLIKGYLVIVWVNSLMARMVITRWNPSLHTCRHWWVWTGHRQLPCECRLYWCDG